MNDTGKSAKLAKYDRLYEQIKGIFIPLKIFGHD